MARSAPEFATGYSYIDPEDPFEERIGPFYRPDDRSGGLRFMFRVEPRHLNRSGYVHGGLMMTFADSVLCASAVENFEEERTVTVSMNAEFVAAGELGDLVEARGELIRRTRSLAFVRCTIAAGDRTLMTASGIIKCSRRE